MSSNLTQIKTILMVFQTKKNLRSKLIKVSLACMLMKKKNNFLTPWNLENKVVDISMYNPAELFGVGVSIENIINQNYDSDIVEKLRLKIKNSIQNYKELKLK